MRCCGRAQDNYLKQDAENARQLRSRLIEILNGDPAASPTRGAYKRGISELVTHPFPTKTQYQSGVSSPNTSGSESRYSGATAFGGVMSTLFLHPTRSVYYYRMSVPARLRRLLRGRVQIWRCLKTSDNVEAKARLAEWDSRVQRKCQKLMSRNWRRRGCDRKSNDHAVLSGSFRSHVKLPSVVADRTNGLVGRRIVDAVMRASQVRRQSQNRE